MVLITNNFLKLASGEFDLKTIFTLLLSDKCIDKLQNLDALESLRWADFSKNKIVRIENLNPNLSTLMFLNLSHNQIQRVSCLESLTNLQSLKLNANPIGRLADVQGIIPLKALTHLWFQNIDGQDRCPVCSTDNYRDEILKLNSNIQSLDSQRKNLPDLLFKEECDLDLPDSVPSWELELGNIDDIVNPTMVNDKLNPLVADFENKVNECKKRLQESDKMLKTMVIA